MRLMSILMDTLFFQMYDPYICYFSAAITTVALCLKSSKADTFSLLPDGMSEHNCSSQQWQNVHNKLNVNTPYS